MMEPLHLHLTASQLAPAPPAPRLAQLTASTAARTIAGPVVEYDVVGYASTGPTIFTRGSLRFPDQLGNVKFLCMHDMERPLGSMAGLDLGNPAMPYGTFSVAPGPAGDEALQMTADGRRDGLSVGCLITDYEWRESDGVLIVKAADVTEVSHVTIPAFRRALVSEVSASLKGPDMSRTALAPVPLTAGTPGPQTPPATEPPSSPAPQSPAAPTTPEQQPAQQPAPVPAAAAAQQPAPQAPPVIVHERSRGADLATVSARIAGHFTAGGTGANLTAALTDVLVADDAGGAGTTNAERGQWVDELWQATRTERPTIDSLTSRPLTSLTVRGWKRVYPGTPMINKYAGNKTEIPASGKITTAPAEETAQRWAGGWDIDRAYIDFNDEQMVRANLEAATDDYKQQTEADVVAKLLAAATVVPDSGSLTGALSQLGLRAGALGARLSLIQFAPDLWAEFLDLPADTVPWWLQKQGSISLGDATGNAGGLRFGVNQELPAGVLEAHDSRAATFYEKNPPVKVQALDISRAGVDLGVYGYTALLVNDARAIFTTGVTTPAV